MAEAAAALKADDGAPEPGKKPVAAKPAANAADPGRPWPDKSTAADPGRLAKPLPESRWSLREFPDPGHRIVLERGTPYEAIFEPSFWANIASKAKFQPGQTIDVLNDEMTVFATLKILDCGRNWCVVGEYHKRSIDELVKSRPPAKLQPRHRAEFAGPIDKWRIIRDDNQVIKTGFESELAAQQYLNDYLRRLGA